MPEPPATVPEPVPGRSDLRTQARALLESPSIGRDVRSLHPVALYFLTKELGTADAAPLLRHATEEQLRLVVDLETWQNDEPNVALFAEFLQALGQDDPGTMVRGFLKLDAEHQTWFLREILSIRLVDPEPEEHQGPDERLSPDGLFWLSPRPNDLAGIDPFVLVDLIYRFNIDEARRLLQDAQVEADPLLVESARQFREGRLLDCGFPASDEAWQIFVPWPDERLPQVEGDFVERPGLMVRHISTDEGLFERSLRAVEDPSSRARIEHEWVGLVNASLVARRTPLDGVSDLRFLGRQVNGVLSCALESLTDGGNLSTAIRLLTRHPLLALFRVGQRFMHRLRSDADGFARDPVGAAWLHQEPRHGTDELDQAVVRGLLLRQPVLVGRRSDAPRTLDAIAQLEDVAWAEDRLSGIRERVLG